jgi:hypothetical protein
MDHLHFSNCNTAGLGVQMLVLSVEYNHKKSFKNPLILIIPMMILEFFRVQQQGQNLY